MHCKKIFYSLLSPKPPLLNQRRASPPATRRLDIPPLLSSSVDNMVVLSSPTNYESNTQISKDSVGKHFSSRKIQRSKHVT